MRRLLPFILALTVIATGCSPKPAESLAVPPPEPEPTPQKKTGTSWYWFSDTGIHWAASPSEIPGKAFTPWTEAVRVADAAIVEGIPSLLINRLGVLSPGTSGTGLHTDPDRFASHTAAGFYRTEAGTAVRLYRNSIFAGDTKSGIALTGYDPVSGSFTDLYFAADLGVPAQAQCVSLDRVGSMWYAAFKNDKAGKVEFSYLEFPAFPARNRETGAYDLSDFRNLDTTGYQESVAPFAWSSAPDQLRSLLSAIPDETPISVRVHTRSARSPQTYVREGPGEPLACRAWVSDEATSALFADGTFYFRADNSTETVKSIRLPALTRGYVYGEYVIVGKKLVTAWEEQRFYETGRAGLLEIPLPDALY